MAEFTFAAPYPMVYPEGKDAAGRNLSLVQPGDIRDLDEAPDQWWRETTDEDRAALLAADPPADPPADPSGDPPGPVPVPVPGA